MANDNEGERQIFHAVSGFRTAIPQDAPDLLLFELKTIDAGVIRLSMTKESAMIFGQEVQKAAAAS